METYKLLKTQNGDLYFNNDSPMYPVELENQINSLAGECITKFSPSIFGSFVNTFIIPADKISIFKERVFKNIGNKKQDDNSYIVWNKNEECPEI